MMHFGFLTIDILVLIVLCAILFFATRKTEKRLIVALIVATYPAVLLFTNLRIITLEAGLPRAVWFLVIYAVIASILWSYIKSRTTSNTVRSIFDHIALTVAYVALLISVSVHFVPALQYIYTFSNVFADFVATIDPGVMLALPLVVLALTSKRDIV